MAPSSNSFRPIFLFLVLVGLSTLITMAFYYRRSVMSAPVPSEESPRQPVESLAARSLMGATDKPAKISIRNHKNRTILTMFTTFKPSKDKFQTYSNVLHNWALFLPQIQPILYTYETDEKLKSLAKSLGWLVIESPRVSATKVPYLKEMYFEAQRQVESTFYGYFNGDLLFDNGLIDTVTLVEKYLDQLKKTLVVGQRTNFPFKGQEIYKKADVTAMARAKGKLFRTDAEDFFVIAHNTFVWDKLADIVIGRPAYDNYVVGMAIMNKVSVIDATKTLLTLHQSGTDGDFAGFKNKDRNFNKQAIGPFNWGRGVTSASQYFTKYKDGHIELWKRSPAKALILKIKSTIPTPTEPVPVVSAPSTKPNSTNTKLDAKLESNKTNVNISLTTNSTLLTILKNSKFNTTSSQNATLENHSIESKQPVKHL